MKHLMKHLYAKTRMRANRELTNLANYHEGIPLDKISGILHAHGLRLIQEDNTEFSGIFCGSEGQAYLPLAYIHSKRESRGCTFYTRIENALLVLTWYKMPSGRYEIVTYVS